MNYNIFILLIRKDILSVKNYILNNKVASVILLCIMIPVYTFFSKTLFPENMQKEISTKVTSEPIPLIIVIFLFIALLFRALKKRLPFHIKKYEANYLITSPIKPESFIIIKTIKNFIYIALPFLIINPDLTVLLKSIIFYFSYTAFSYMLLVLSLSNPKLLKRIYITMTTIIVITFAYNCCLLYNLGLPGIIAEYLIPTGDEPLKQLFLIITGSYSSLFNLDVFTYSSPLGWFYGVTNLKFTNYPDFIYLSVFLFFMSFVLNHSIKFILDNHYEQLFAVSKKIELNRKLRLTSVDDIGEQRYKDIKCFKKGPVAFYYTKYCLSYRKLLIPYLKSGYVFCTGCALFISLPVYFKPENSNNLFIPSFFNILILFLFIMFNGIRSHLTNIDHYLIIMPGNNIKKVFYANLYELKENTLIFALMNTVFFLSYNINFANFILFILVFAVAMLFSIYFDFFMQSLTGSNNLILSKIISLIIKFIVIIAPFYIIQKLNFIISYFNLDVTPAQGITIPLIFAVLTYTFILSAILAFFDKIFNNIELR